MTMRDLGACVGGNGYHLLIKQGKSVITRNKTLTFGKVYGVPEPKMQMLIEKG